MSDVPAQKQIIQVIAEHISAQGPEALRRARAQLETRIVDLIAEAESLAIPDAYAVSVRSMDGAPSSGDTVYGPYPTTEKAAEARVSLLSELGVEDVTRADAPWSATVIPFYYETGDNGPLDEREDIMLDEALSYAGNNEANLAAHEKNLLRRRQNNA